MVGDARLVETCLLLHQRVTEVNCGAVEDNLGIVTTSWSFLLVKLVITFGVQREALPSYSTH